MWLGLLQGGTCGFGMRGQKARSGSGVRPGFEGGQTPLYRKLPKLKGIAGGAELVGIELPPRRRRWVSRLHLGSRQIFIRFCGHS